MPTTIIYSTNRCSGEGIEAFNRISGKTINFGREIGFGAVSQDYSRSAWVRFGPSDNDGHSRNNGKRVQIDLFDTTSMQVLTDFYRTPIDIWQLVIGNDDAIYYSTYIVTGQIPKAIEQQHALANATDPEHQRLLSFPMSMIGIYRINPSTGQSEEIYRSNGSYIGRMELSPDEQTLYFTEIPSMEQPVSELLHQSYIEPLSIYPILLPQLAPSLYELDLLTGDITLITKNISRMDIFFPKVAS